MNEAPSGKRSNDTPTFAEQVGAKATRKLRAQRHSGQSVWLGLGMIGLIGWSVAIPTLLGVALGRWLDGQHVTPHSWTLMLLVIGLFIGCLNAWHWVAKEDRAIREEQHDDVE